MQGALAKVPGVADSDLDFRAKTVVVTVEEGADVKPEALVKALEGAGFGATVN